MPDPIGAVHPRYRPPAGHLLTVPAAEIVAWGSPAERTQRVRQLQRLRQARARAHFPSFVEYIACNESTGEPVRMQWFHDEWSQAMDTGNRVLIIACRNSGKTSQVVWRVIWELGRNPDLRIKIACAADGRAKERLFEISQHITMNPRVREVFPNLEPDPNASWSKHALYLKRTARHRDASVEALGITATATGGRCDLLIADDVVDRRNALSMPALREGVKQAWKSDWTNLLEPDSRIWYIATLWHRCLPHDQWVVTDAGIVSAGNLGPSHRLRIGPGRWEPALAITRRPYSGPLVNMGFGGSTVEVRCTPNHRWRTTRGELSADQIVEGDWLWYDTRPSEIMGNDELLDLGPRPDAATDAYPVQAVLGRKTKATPAQVQALIDKGRTYTEIAADLGYNGKSMIHHIVSRFGLRPGRKNVRSLNRNPIADPLFWRFIGYWCAEGYIDDSTGAVRLCFGGVEEERGFAHDAMDCLQRSCGLESNAKYQDNRTILQFSCGTLREWLRRMFFTGSGEIRLPHWFERLPQPLVDEWMCGYWRGDGCYSSKLNSRAARFGTISKSLAYGVGRVITQRYGFASSVYSCEGSSKISNARTSYDVRSHPSVLVQVGALQECVMPSQRKGHRVRVDADGTWCRVMTIGRTWYDGVVTDIATATGYFDLPGVTTHNSDLTHDLLANPEFKCLDYSIGPDMGAIWPEKWPEHALRARQREIGTIEFNRAFMNRVIDEESSVFREGWLHFADLATDPAFQAAARAGELHTLTSYDTATAVGDDADYSAGVALAVHPQARRCYVLDAWHARQTVAQQAAQIYREHQHYRPYRVLIEKAGQAVVDEWLLSEHPELRPVVETVRPTIGKVQRAQAITPLFERGEVIFSAHLDPDAPGWQPGRECLVHELRDFPVGKNDDQCLVAGTMIATTRGDIPIERIVTGMRVITPFGPRRVLVSKKTGNAGVIHRVGLTGTPNHPVFVHGKGFLRMDSLTQYSDCAKLSIGGLLRWTTRIHSWRQKRSHSTGGCIASWEGRDVITSASLPRAQEGKNPRGSTLPSGNMPMVRALARDMRYIISMAIHLITALITLSIYHAANTLRKLSRLKKCLTIWKGLGRSLRSGIDQRRGGRGTGITHPHVNDEHISTSAFTVGTSSRLKTSTQSSAVIIARTNTTGQSEDMIGQSNASFAVRSLILLFRSIHLKFQKHAPTNAEENLPSADVYNLTVDAAGCYFANGVLVSNCDALVQGLAAARRYFLDAWAPGVQSGELAVTIGAGGADGAYPF